MGLGGGLWIPFIASAVGGRFFAPDFPSGRAGMADFYPFFGRGGGLASPRPNIDQNFSFFFRRWTF